MESNFNKRYRSTTSSFIRYVHILVEVTMASANRLLGVHRGYLFVEVINFKFDFSRTSHNEMNHPSYFCLKVLDIYINIVIHRH